MAADAMKRTDTIPIDPASKDAGSIDYIYNTDTDAKGVFVSTYYFRDDGSFQGQDKKWAKTDIYKSGLLHYLKLTEQAPFQGWKLVLYIDAISWKNPINKTNQGSASYQKHLTEWNAISSHPNLVVAVVNWPEYSVGENDGQTIDNAILRALRIKALADFARIPVFIRDADTLFENLVKVRPIYEELLAWEAKFKETLETITASKGETLIIASQPNYHRQWHVHPTTGQNTPGCYAALTSTLGGLAEWVDPRGELWGKCLAYLRTHSQVTKGPKGRVPSNIGKPTYIGKDEQLLSYVILPAMAEKVFFYYLEYIQVEGTKIVVKPETPFADTLLLAGLDRYPSPYIESLGEALLPLDASANTKRKDANEKTEGTILNPASIPLALTPSLNKLMHTIFAYYSPAAAKQGGDPPAAAKQGGGGRKTYRRKRRRNRKRRHTRRR